MSQTTIRARSGEAKVVRSGDPLWCSLENRRVRFCRKVDEYTVEVMDNDGLRVLPDYRHVSQVLAY